MDNNESVPHVHSICRTCNRSVCTSIQTVSVMYTKAGSVIDIVVFCSGYCHMIWTLNELSYVIPEDERSSHLGCWVPVIKNLKSEMEKVYK